MVERREPFEEETRQHAHGQEEAGPAGDPARTVQRQAAAGEEMAERLASAELAALVAPMMARLEEEWIEDGTNINDGVELLRALEAARFLSANDAANVRKEGLAGAARLRAPRPSAPCAPKGDPSCARNVCGDWRAVRC